MQLSNRDMTVTLRIHFSSANQTNLVVAEAIEVFKVEGVCLWSVRREINVTAEKTNKAYHRGKREEWSDDSGDDGDGWVVVAGRT